MSWDIKQRLYLDLSQQGGSVLLSKSDTGVGDRVGDLVFRKADCFLLQLMFIDRAASNDIVPLPSGYQIVVAGKLLTSSVPGGSVLFSASGFTTFTESSNTGYVATLDLNTAELSSALGSLSEIDVQVDCEIQNPANTMRLTLAFNVKVKPQSYAGEGSPTPSTPTYPAPSAIITTDDMGGDVTFEAEGNSRWLCINGTRVQEFVLP